MIKMKTILHPTDFSEPSKYALGYAVACAKEFEAKLYLLHVIPDIPVVTYYGMMGIPPSPEFMMDMEKEARKALENLLPPEVRGTIPVQCLLRNGAAFVEIIRCAEEIKADMIVCGTHGRTGLKHVLIGSVAENVVRHSSCPVLTVRHPEHKFEMPTGA
jgi:nucleotide-binding universal stress UspA family protein